MVSYETPNTVLCNTALCAWCDALPLPPASLRSGTTGSQNQSTRWRWMQFSARSFPIVHWHKICGNVLAVGGGGAFHVYRPCVRPPSFPWRWSGLKLHLLHSRTKPSKQQGKGERGCWGLTKFNPRQNHSRRVATFDQPNGCIKQTGDDIFFATSGWMCFARWKFGPACKFWAAQERHGSSERVFVCVYV